ncbi:MAG TPA: hypothetical protein PKG54_19225 [Phycisphaerae bacterium]|jgi:hypothetical protein|nr:hypothetical protein [Phycisphaerae bacterium]HOB76647.1 hypothetical protein [Phycisphaerae bacterium]HOJ56665.1 hypothetical protein [Phycisphaerae bacterium]HOL28450.1 hypothetical protein [Phycisphaerae bacterium]HPP22945.1 hypothetical protein [Phycisphaerae bacterium]
MRSDEILKSAADKIGVKALAAGLKLSPALVYKWCQPCRAEDPDGSGALNPLDRLAQIVELTGDIEVVNWLCKQAGGFFVPDVEVDGRDVRTDLIVGAQQLVKEFSDMLEEVSRSIANDLCIEESEAVRIRHHWETLKRVAERFVTACEAGMFGPEMKGEG